MRTDGNDGAEPNYEPNSFGGPAETPRVGQPPLEIVGEADRYDDQERVDDYKQPGDLYRDVLSRTERDRLIDNIVADLGGVSREEIQVRQVEHFYKADPEFGYRVADGLGLDIEDHLDEELLAVENEIADAPVVADLLD